MSKTDELRAMREAKYARAAAALSGQPQAQKAEPKPKTAAKPKTAKADPKTEPQTATDDGLCGHRSMNGRSCTREAGHAAKSHRYS
jgi:hypothetical protein